MEKEQIRFWEKVAADVYVGLEEMDYDGWELRFTEGFTGRANSVQIKEESTIDLIEKVEFCEKAYAEHGLPCMFKLTDTDRDFISLLEKRGYHVAKPTDVMTLPLDGVETPNMKDFDTSVSENADTERDADAIMENAEFATSPEDWFESYFIFENMQDEKNRELTRKIHAKVPASQVYIKVLYEGKTAAVASLAIESGYSLLHNVVVDPELRGKGLGKKLCQAAILKSKECGASHIFLQVMQNNPIALNLYRKLGFEKQYTYYYVTNKVSNSPIL